MVKFADNTNMKDEYDFSNGVKNRYAERSARIKAAGKYFTRAFDYERGKVEIREIEANTHRVLSSRLVNIDELSQV